MILIFNDIAGSEILLILVFVLIFFGSKSIPTLARTFGKTIRQIKDATEDVQNEIKKSGLDIKKDLNLTSLIEETKNEIQQPLDQMANDIDASIKYQPKKTLLEPKKNPLPRDVDKTDSTEDSAPV